MAQTGMYQPLQMDSRQTPAAAVAAAMVQFSQSPHGYAPLGTYGLSHQPPPNPQLSNAYGQQSLFVQPPAAHQGQDLYSSSQYRVQPPYPQSQHVSSNQVYAFCSAATNLLTLYATLPHYIKWLEVLKNRIQLKFSSNQISSDIVLLLLQSDILINVVF